MMVRKQGRAVAAGKRKWWKLFICDYLWHEWKKNTRDNDGGAYKASNREKNAVFK